MAPALGFVHRFAPAEQPGRAPLLLLHGTGGDEHDLIPFGAAVASGAALLSPRGQVLERGMPRFFGRLAEGVFDPDEVRRRVHALGDFVAAARAAYSLAAPVALGFSNGANAAAVVMLLRPGCLAGAALLRPMDVLDDPPAGRHPGAVLMVSGAADPLVAPPDLDGLAARLAGGGAAVERQVLPAGHGLMPRDGAGGDLAAPPLPGPLACRPGIEPTPHRRRLARREATHELHASGCGCAGLAGAQSLISPWSSPSQ